MVLVLTAGLVPTAVPGEVLLVIVGTGGGEGQQPLVIEARNLLGQPSGSPSPEVSPGVLCCVTRSDCAPCVLLAFIASAGSDWATSYFFPREKSLLICLSPHTFFPGIYGLNRSPLLPGFSFYESSRYL